LAGRLSRVQTKKKTAKEKRITRYQHSDVGDPRTPETGHTQLLGDELVVTLPLDSGWSKAIDVGRLPNGDGSQAVIIEMDPAVDPMLLWSGKRSRRDVSILPLQRNEVVAESRIARIVDRAREAATDVDTQPSLFAELEKELREGDKGKRVEFYTHDEGWKNKLICGDSLAVIESLLHYEGLRGRVRMIYVDPPYGIKYDANFQQRIDTAENDARDQADDVVTIKAFRDTWALGVHSYLSYLQERLYVCRDLLSDGGSIFVQMNVENEHLVRALMDEVFGKSNYYATIAFTKTTGFTTTRLSSVYDVLLWYCKDIGQIKYQQLYQTKLVGLEGSANYVYVELPDGSRRRLKKDELDDLESLPHGWRIYRLSDISAQGSAKEAQPFEFQGHIFEPPPNSHWKTTSEGMRRLVERKRVEAVGKRLYYVRFADDFPVSPLNNIWMDTGRSGFGEPSLYAVQTHTRVLERCISMTTDPGDLVIDPTCGSGTTAFVAEKLGRRWVTCDTSRVAINVARRRLLSAVFDHHPTRSGAVSSGFVYKTVDRITLKSLAYDLEPEKVDLVNEPEVDPNAVRVTGPFEVMTLGRYSLEDWKGYVVGEGTDAGRLENYIGVVCRLYRKDAALDPTGGLVHAVSEDKGRSVGISVGPITGRVTGRQILEAVTDAAAAGLDEVHVLGWAFETNVNEVKATAEAESGVDVRLIMIRPDTLAEGLRTLHGDALFSPLAEPDIEISASANDSVTVTLRGVAVFDRKQRVTEYRTIESGYIAAWYLDQDYDGDCFVDSQMFFDFKKKPAIEHTLGINVDPDEWNLRSTSDPFKRGKYGRLAVKVVDVFGNESTVVRAMS
jgi:adenine-specific DNA-methyltransferase